MKARATHVTLSLLIAVAAAITLPGTAPAAQPTELHGRPVRWHGVPDRSRA